jgi:methionyl aminopeptidase
MISRKSAKELDKMRRAGRALAEVHTELAEAVAPGVRIKDLDDLADKLIRERGGVPSFLGYRGYPGRICASVNEVIVHGIPDDRVLEDGDILSIDVGLTVDGWHADSAVTHGVGTITDEAERLLDVTQRSLEAGIDQCRAGGRLSDISHAIESLVVGEGFSVVREFVGHGIGRALHEDPQVPNFGPPGEGPVLQPGLVLAIEPMVNVGGWKTKTLSDGWTVVTLDGSLSAHFEHTVAVTDNGPEVLTARHNGG